MRSPRVLCILLGLALVACGKGSKPQTKADSTGGTATSTAQQKPTGGDTAQTKSSSSADSLAAIERAMREPVKGEFDMTGAYFISGTAGKEFADIDHLSLATIDENANPAPLNGFIRPKRHADPDYKLAKPALEGRHLTFTTNAVKGVSYTFEGNFERAGNFPADPPPSDAVVLGGMLRKLDNGKVVAETAVRFTYSAGG